MRVAEAHLLHAKYPKETARSPNIMDKILFLFFIIV